MCKPEFDLQEVRESTMGYHNYTDQELLNIAFDAAPRDSIVYELAKRLEDRITHGSGKEWM